MINILWLIVCLPFLSLIYWTLKLGIGPTPSSGKVINALIRLCPSEVYGVIYETGSGWGHLQSRLNRQYPTGTITGYERSPLPFLYSRLRYPGLNIRYQNFLHQDFSDAGLIVCYLCPSQMKNMKARIWPMLPQGCLLISHTFALPDIKPEQTTQANDLYRSAIYLYRKASD